MWHVLVLLLVSGEPSNIFESKEGYKTLAKCQSEMLNSVPDEDETEWRVACVKLPEPRIKHDKTHHKSPQGH